MDAQHSPKRGLWMACAAAALVLTTTACQDLHTFVTGDQFFKAREGTVRVETELYVEIQESFFEDLVNVEDPDQLRQAVRERVRALADVGMRFYPILTEDYAANSPRPQHRMVIRIENLDVVSEHKLVEEKDKAPWMRSTVKTLNTQAFASVEKRRPDAPPLIIGENAGQSQVAPQGVIEEGDEAQVTYGVRREDAEHQQLYITQENVLNSVEAAVVSALRGVVEPVDREAQTRKP